MYLKKIQQYNTDSEFRIAQDFHYTGDDSWDWSIWLEAPEEELDKVTNVIYNLHYTFAEPVRTVTTRENKFRLESSGWGTFTIYARVNFKDETVLELEHELELYYPEDGEAAPS